MRVAEAAVAGPWRQGLDCRRATFNFHSRPIGWEPNPVAVEAQRSQFQGETCAPSNPAGSFLQSPSRPRQPPHKMLRTPRLPTPPPARSRSPPLRPVTRQKHETGAYHHSPRCRRTGTATSSCSPMAARRWRRRPRTPARPTSTNMRSRYGAALPGWHRATGARAMGGHGGGGFRQCPHVLHRPHRQAAAHHPAWRVLWRPRRRQADRDPCQERGRQPELRRRLLQQRRRRRAQRSTTSTASICASSINTTARTCRAPTSRNIRCGTASRPIPR